MTHFTPAPAMIGEGRRWAPIAEQALPRTLMGAALIYLAIYCLEGPVRYALFLGGADNLIFLRDILIWLPLGALFAVQAYAGRIQYAFYVAGALLAFHGFILLATVGDPLSLAYGAKVLINLLFGFLLAGSLLTPDAKTRKVLALLWGLMLIGICLDKFGVMFPWVGIRTIVGDLQVDVSKDWFISDPLARRVAGFTRSSIAAAAVIPLMTIVLMSGMRSMSARIAMAFIGVVAVGLTTQKGSILAFTAIAAVLCLPGAFRARLLRLLLVAFVVLAVALPILTFGLHIDHGNGVFSTESLSLRIEYTWPEAWAWIQHHQLFPFGVGLGGISGPQRIYAPDHFNPADNIFVLMYAYFGVLAFAYIAWMTWLGLRRTSPEADERLTPAIAILAFVFGYGAVLSVLEDQSAALFLGAALGGLWREVGRALANPGLRFQPVHQG